MPQALNGGVLVDACWIWKGLEEAMVEAFRSEQSWWLYCLESI